MVNEILQWIVLLFIGMFVFGLTRQLGRYMVGHRQEIANDIGPDPGKPLPLEILDADERQEFEHLILESPERFGMLLVVEEECPGCQAMLARIEDGLAPEGVPRAILSKTTSAAFRRRLEQLADIVVVDEHRMDSAGLRVTPFVFVLDRDLRVGSKSLTSDLARIAEEWRRDTSPAPRRTLGRALSLSTNGGGKGYG